jgi:limonene-1,2-epoxide hydrolase
VHHQQHPAVYPGQGGRGGEPVTGKANIANTIASFVRPGPPGIESIEFRVINIAADGPVVMTERVDVFKLSSNRP